MFLSIFEVSIVLSDEQGSSIHLMQLNIGIERSMYVVAMLIIHVVVRSRVHLAQGIRELRSLS
jgi:GTP pyrophosphokinase/guanosine-3',5'-bis(diphosphate) 3'-pyrophosphohydrolase